VVRCGPLWSVVAPLWSVVVRCGSLWSVVVISHTGKIVIYFGSAQSLIGIFRTLEKIVKDKSCPRKVHR